MQDAVQNILSSRLFSTRGGTIAVGAFAALLALLILLLYLSHYRSSLRSSSAPTPVLVAKRLIPQGTSGDLLGNTSGFQPATVPKDGLKTGAITDPASLRGLVALHDIYPGQQLTIADFTPTASATLGSRLIGSQRAISIPVDPVHAVNGQVAAGDRVDIYAALSGQSGGTAASVVKPIMQNVVVLGISGATTGGGSVGASASSGAGAITLRVSPAEAGQLAFASGNGTIWVILRPATGARPTGPSAVTMSTLLSEKKTVPAGN